MKEFQVEFLVNGYVSQSMQIHDESITQEDLIKGLQSGKYITTVGGTMEILETTNWTAIGKVVSTDVLDDMEYSDFGNE